MKALKLQRIISYFGYILLSVVFVFCSSNDHKAKETVNLKNYKGCIIVGKQYDWHSKQTGW